MRISDWSSDVCSSDLAMEAEVERREQRHGAPVAENLEQQAERMIRIRPVRYARLVVAKPPPRHCRGRVARARTGLKRGIGDIDVAVARPARRAYRQRRATTVAPQRRRIEPAPAALPLLAREQRRKKVLAARRPPIVDPAPAHRKRVV